MRSKLLIGLIIVMIAAGVMIYFATPGPTPEEREHQLKDDPHPEDIKALVGWLEDDDSVKRMYACKSLGKVACRYNLSEEEMDEVLSTLCTTMSRDDRLPQKAAIGALGRIAGSNPGQRDFIVGKLIEVLDDDEVAHVVVKALSTSGADAKVVIPYLINLLQDDYGGDGQEDHEDDFLIGEAVQRNMSILYALGEYGHAAKGYIPGITTALNKSSSISVVQRAIEALAKISLDDAMAGVTRKLEVDDPAIRLAAIAAFFCIKPEPVVIETLASALSNSDPRVCARAAEKLGRYGPRARDSVEALEAALYDENEDIGCVAAEALGKIGPYPEVIQALMKRLSNDPPIKIIPPAAKALSNFGPAAAVTIPVLEKLRKDEPGYEKFLTSVLKILRAESEE